MGRQRDTEEQKAWVLQTMPLLFIEEIFRGAGGGVRCGSCDASSEREPRRGRESAVVRGTSGHGYN